MVFNGDATYIMGGSDPYSQAQSAIYKLENGTWTKLPHPQELQTARSGMFATLISSSLTTCAKSKTSLSKSRLEL